MKNRILKICVDDIIIDPEGNSDMINSACSRKIPMQVTGVCQVIDNILVVLEECEVVNDYVLAPFESVNIDEISTEIATRFSFGFSLIGAFDLKDRKWALLKKMREC